MKEEKKTGSYYTPLDLIQFMVDYLEKEQQDFSNVLEPSAGDGRFLSLLLPKVKHIEAIEVFEEKVKQIQQVYSESKVEVKKRNFLEQQKAKDMVIPEKKKKVLQMKRHSNKALPFSVNQRQRSW